MKTVIRTGVPRGPMCSWSVFLLFLQSFASISSLASAESVLVIEPEHVLHWILSHPEAAFNDKQEIRRISGDNEHDGEYAVHATSAIEKDEILFQVPWDLILSVPEINKPRAAEVPKEKSKDVSNSDDEGADGEGADDEDEDDEDSDEDKYTETNDEDEDDEVLVNCDLVKLLQKELNSHQTELKTGKSSSFIGPYLNYIIYEAQHRRKVPSTFTEAGQDLFVDLLLDWAPEEDRDKYRAPPADSIFLTSECISEDSDDEDDDDDETREKSKILQEDDVIDASTTMWVVQKADTRLLVPLVRDIYPHGNGEKANNTRIEWKEGEYYRVVASRNVNKGEILKHSLNLCTGCLTTEKGRIGRRKFEIYGTAALFRDYGFIQKYPQTWLFDDCGFEIDSLDEKDVLKEGSTGFYVNGKKLQVAWITHLPEERDFRNELIKYLYGLHRRLVRSKNRAVNLYYPGLNGSFEGSEDDSTSEDDLEDGIEHEFEHPSVPLDEWDAMLSYVDAVSDAVAIAHNSLVSEGHWLEVSNKILVYASNDDVEADSCILEGRILAMESHYDDLKAEEDDLDYVTPTCSDHEWMQFQNYKEIESIVTPYQEAQFHTEPNTGDICMHSNSTLQICTSYRPQYNEMMVHYPARFAKSIERVLIVGGGNGMLLHEVLKYPTLKMAVVLELDQAITRKSFKHFQTQPHFDDNRVKWMFGKIAPSLLHLLYGHLAFDLIIVDNDQISQWGTIVRGLSAFETLALLLHVDGVLVKNGRYMDQVHEALDFAVQAHFNLPKICSQTVAFASKSIDFLHHDQKDHGLSHHFLLDFDEMGDQFDYMHDYYYTRTSRQKCRWLLGGKSADEYDSQVRPYGIYKVIDIENIPRRDLKLNDLLQQVVRSSKLHPISTPFSFEFGNRNVGSLLLFKEGYISARWWASEGYLAVGVNLWKSYDKFRDLEARLLKKLGTQSKSSFQVIVGGMEESAGHVEPKQNCESPTILERTSNVVGGRGTLRPVLTEVLNLIHTEEIVAGVVCGLESSRQPCMAKEVLEANPRISQVIVLWTCPNLQTSDASPNLPNMSECERNLLEQLDVTMDEAGLYFDLFVVDNSAPIEMAQIFNSIWSNPKHREWYLTAHFNVFVGISLKPPEDNYHRQMLERYRRHLRYDPVNRAELLIEIDGARMEVDVVSAGDPYAFYNLHVIEGRIQKKIGSLGKVEVQRIVGGQRDYKEDGEAEDFPRELYDSTRSTMQYQSQMPLGREAIIQFRIDSQSGKPLALEKLTEHLQQTLEKIGLKDATRTLHPTDNNGYVMKCNSNNASVILVWNGANNININVFSLDKDFASDFLESFKIPTIDGIGFLLSQRDEYPRGTGRVVNFGEDIIPPDEK